jgi:CzcA family heavy metal efflux pump
MKLAATMDRHRRFILILLGALAAAGAAATLRLPVALFPRVDFPRVMINVDAGDQSAERMAIEVTRPLEEAVRGVPGVRYVRSRTSRGGAEVSVGFGWGDDMVSGLLQVDAAVSQVSQEFPEGTTVDIRRMDPTVFPVLGFSLTSAQRSLVELRELAQYRLRPALTSVAGVARVAVLGGEDAEYQVWVDPERLAAYGLTPEDVAEAIRRDSVLEAVGRVEDHGRLYLVVTDEERRTAEQIGQTVIREGPASRLRVADVADVVATTAARWTRVSADDQEAVLFQVYQQPDANTVQIADGVAAELARLKSELPPDVQIHKWYDQTDLILASAVSVRNAIAIGALLAALVVLAFLRNLRVTIVAVAAVVAVLAATGLFIRLWGMSFNVMSLGGVAAAVGLIIDDAIVVLEHLVRRLREGLDAGEQGPAPSFVAAAELTRPLAGSSLATVIIFSPLALITGVTGAFFRALSITMASALVVSFLVAWLGVPALVALLGRRRGADGATVKARTGRSWLARGYAALMRPLLRFPWLSAALMAGPLIGAGVYCASHVGSGFIPSIDEGGFVLDYHAPWGTSLSETDRMVREVEAILRDTPEVQTTSRRTGLQLGGALTEVNEGDFFVRLRPPPRRPIGEVMDEVRERVEHTVPGLDIEMALLMEDLIGDLLGVPQPIEVKLYSDDAALLSELGPAVAAEISQVDGVVDVEDGQIIAGNALALEVDEEAAGFEGLTVEDVSQAVSAYLDGVVATKLQSGPKIVDVRVVLPHAQDTRQPALEALLIRAPDGHTVPLSRVAHFVRETGQPQITHEDMSRMTAVTARLSGRDLGSAVAEVQRRLASSGVLPSSVYYRMGGLYAEQQEAFRSLSIVVAIAAVLILVLLTFLYERLSVALAAITSSLLSLPAVYVGLWLTGTELNITALMGLVMIVGMATEVSIFYVSEVAERRHLRGDARLVAAGVTRARPIAMMNAAAILSLLPLAVGLGEGVGLLTPLAIAIISGLVVQLPIGVLLLPCLLKTFSGGWLRRADTPAIEGGTPAS